MMLQINENLRVRSDKYNFILQEKAELGDKTVDKSKIGDTIWNDCAFFPSLKAVHIALLRKSIKESDLNELNNLVDHIDKLHNEFIISLEKYGKFEKCFDE